jgi:hypothetical protein
LRSSLERANVIVASDLVAGSSGRRGLSSGNTQSTTDIIVIRLVAIELLSEFKQYFSASANDESSAKLHAITGQVSRGILKQPRSTLYKVF